MSALNKDIEKFGIEESKFACDYIKKNFKEINIRNSNIYELEKYNNQFDVIMFYHVIEHLEKPSEAITLINKRLKKDGILIIGTPNIDSFVSKVFRENFRHLIPAHICLYGEKSLSSLLKKNNFKILKIEKPFFKNVYNNFLNYLKLFKLNQVSPAFYGSIITYYCKKK